MSDEEECIDITPDKNGGVLKRIIKEGTDDYIATKGDTIAVHYVGWLDTGREFDSSRDRNEPFKFKLGSGQVIKAWDLGVATMKKGEKSIFICRSDYAYGSTGSPPKIYPNATLKFEIELIDGTGQDISPELDGTIIRKIIVEGEKYASPSEGSTVRATIVGSHEGRVFLDQEMSFIIGEGLNVGLPEGVDRALRLFTKGEKSTIHLKGSRFTFGANPPLEYNLPCNAELDFTIFLKDYEKVKASWELTGTEKLDAAQSAKERGTEFLKEGKYRLAVGKYLRVIELLSYETAYTDEKDGKRRDSLLLAAYLNCALAHLKQNETADCIKNCDSALEIDASCIKALYRKAMAFQNQNDMREAIDLYKKVLEIEPDNKAAAVQLHICKQSLVKINEQQKKKYKALFQKLAADDGEKQAEDTSVSPDAAKTSEEMS